MNDAHQQPAPFTYYAFISYSHKDEKWARWIQNALERYRLPAAVRKEAGKPLPSRIHPVFRDTTDLGVGKLADNLKQELEQSKYLIVVCSPNSARPNEQGKHWVNEEVARFCELGHADRIIPVIVEGTKDSAYCPKLAEEDILGLDATQHPKARILNDLVAKILGLRPDELWRREERRLRAKRRWQVLGLSLVSAFLALGIYVALDCTRTVTRAFADYVDSYGLPKGIDPLSPEQVACGHVHYRFEFRGYRFGKPFHADSSASSLLRTLGWHRILKRVVYSEAQRLFTRKETDIVRQLQLNRPVVQSFYFGEDGRLEQIQASYADSSKKGVTHITVHFRWLDVPRLSALVSFTDFQTKKAVRAPLALQGLPDEYGAGRGVFGWNVVFDDEGRPRDTMFLDTFDRPSDHDAGLVFESDPRGRISMIRSKGRADGTGSGKLFAVEYLRGPSSLEIRFRNGENSRTDLLVHYDGAGRPGTIRFPDNQAKGFSLPAGCFGTNPAWHGSSVPLEFRNRFVMRGAEERDRMPAGWNSLFDDNGNEIQRRFVDADGTPTMVDNGYAGWNSVYDNQDREIQRLVVGLDNKPIAIDAGPAGWKREWNGDFVRFTYLDEKLAPVLFRKEHFSSRDSVFDEAGNVIKRIYRDALGRPILQPEGHAGWEASYDSAGKETNTVFLGESLSPILLEGGFAGYSTEFDSGGNPVSRTFLGVGGEPVVRHDGIHRWVKGYDLLGKVTNCMFYGTNGQLVLVNPANKDWACKGERLRDGGFHGGDLLEKVGPIAGWWQKFSPKGDITEIGTVGTNGEPLLNEDGWAIKRFTEEGELWMDSSDTPMAPPLSTNIGSHTFGTSRMKTTWFFNNESGEPSPCNGSDGHYGVKAWFDNAGRLTNTLFLARDGTPFVSKDGHAGISYEHIPTGDGGQKDITTWYDAEGKPVVSKEQNCARISFERVPTGDGGHKKITTWFDAEGKPVVSKERNWARISFERIPTGDGGHKEITTWYDAEEKPVVSKERNCATEVVVYDDWSYLTALIHYDEQGRLMETCPEEGAAYRITEYIHVPGIMYASKCAFIGTNGLPVVGKKSGWASMTFDYNEDYSIVTYHYFGTNGLPIQRPGGYWAYRIYEDKYEYETNIVFLDDKDRPVMHASLGYASRSKTYDYSWGTRDGEFKQVNESYFDADGNLVAKKTGEAGWQDKFDDSGRQIERTYFGTNGKPVMTKYGFATRRMFYDESGIETNRIRLDAGSNVIPAKVSKK